MSRKIATLVALMIFSMAVAQERSSSPYSYYGLGQITFDGTIENRSMAGLSIYSDSIHLNLRNPAAYGNLRLTTFAMGGSHREYTRTTSSLEETSDNTNFEYFSLGIPLGDRLAFGFGLLPYRAVGYDFRNLNSERYSRFRGRGGLNRAYLGIGYEVLPGLNIGAEYRYNFGEEESTGSVLNAGVELGTSETVTTDLGGSSINFGIQYKRPLSDKLNLIASASYSPSTDLNADSERQFYTFTVQSDLTENRNIDGELQTDSESIKLPYTLNAGLGIEKARKLMLGAEYTRLGSSELTNRLFSPESAEFSNAYTARLGGYFIPNYNSINNYFSRIVYRAGLRYGETGLNINDTDISEFGITLGLGLPVGTINSFSNINIGFEYGQLGTTDAGLIREEYFGITLGLSLNDKWFRKRKFN